MVDIRNVSKRFGKTSPFVLKDIHASIKRGEIVGIVGPDGAGKTTLIRLIAGLLHPTKGAISIEGKDTIKDADQISSLIGYMPQKFGLYEDLTVIQNLNLYADLKDVTGENRKRTFDKLLGFTDLARFKDRIAKALSGGMKQKLGLACSLIRKPKLLLLDEPSVGVDPLSRRELWNIVKDLLSEDIAVIWSTSYLDEAERCNSVLLLNEGNLLYHGDPQELIKRVEGKIFKLDSHEENPRTILNQILEQKNVLDGVIEGKSIHFILQEKPKNAFEINLDGLKYNEKPVEDKPRFEDAFVDILGGCQMKHSLLADKTSPYQTDQDTVVQACSLSKTFGTFTAAHNISFSVKHGEIFGLLGPNGAGKSTTFKMLCGLLKPTSGTAIVNNLDLQIAPSKARSQIGYMAQKFSLYGNLSVRQNLRFFSGIYNLTGPHREEMIRQMVEIFNLDPFLDISADTLSLGYKQRLALSCAVMHHPNVLFLDEPTSGVDPITRREFWLHINGLVEKGITIVVTTHFMDEAEYCDRIALVYRSRIIKMGSPQELKNEAKTSHNPFPSLEDAFIYHIREYEIEEYA